MRFVRKLALATAAGALSLGLVGLQSPAQAADTSWGCGGWCRTIPDKPDRDRR